LWDTMSGVFIDEVEVPGNFRVMKTVAFSSDGRALITHDDFEPFPWYWDFTSYPPQCLFSGNMVGPPVGLPPLIWSFHDQWIQVEHCKEHFIRRICYLPPQFSCTSNLIVSSHKTHTRIAVGCHNGQVLIIDVPRNPFNWCLNEEWSYTGLVYHGRRHDPSR